MKSKDIKTFTKSPAGCSTEQNPISEKVVNKSTLRRWHRAVLSLLFSFTLAQSVNLDGPVNQLPPHSQARHNQAPTTEQTHSALHSAILQVPENFEGLVGPNSEQLKIIQELAAGPQASEPVAAEVAPGEVPAHALWMPLVTDELSPAEMLKVRLNELGITVKDIQNSVDPNDPRSMLEGTIFSAEQMATGFDEADLIAQSLGITLTLVSGFESLTIDQKPTCYAGISSSERWVHLPDGRVNNSDIPTPEDTLRNRCELAEFFHIIQQVIAPSETQLSNLYTAEGLSTMLELLLEYTATTEGSPSMIKPTPAEIRGLLDFVLSTSASFRPQIKYHQDGEPYPANYFGLAYPLLLNLVHLTNKDDDRHDPITYQRIVEQSSLLLTLNGLQAVIESDNWFRDFLIYAAIVQNPVAVDRIELIREAFPQIYSAIKSGVAKGLIYNSTSYAQATQLLASVDVIEPAMRQNERQIVISTLISRSDGKWDADESDIYTGSLEVALAVDVAEFRGHDSQEFIAFPFTEAYLVETSAGTVIDIPPTFYVDGRLFQLFGSDAFSFIQVKIKGTDKVYRFELETK